MKRSLMDKLEKLSVRYEELNALMSSEDATADMNVFTGWTREHSELERIVIDYRHYLDTERHIAAAKELLIDPEMNELAKLEIIDGEDTKNHLENSLQKALLPKDPNDDRNVFLEIRAGTGGDESALFAGDLLRMYLKYAERNRWAIEIVSQNESDLGGYKEVVVKICGEKVYAQLKFESGGHRVQRVPETETQGRVHTSACTVAVLPEADQLKDVEINMSELRIDTYRASGAGGQHINKTDSAIRITHLPSGLVVECQEGRSQHKNKAQALSVLASKLNAQQIHDHQEKEAAARKTLIGSGDRSERIRTYNFPQGRLTEHRINLTLYKLAQIMDGELDEVVDNLLTEHQAELLAIASQ
ncbi:peptide chain release factor 1 [Burkholderiales bacterium]|jgi:peptide chain release factor 1|nr:peptide chain release factor 1 [Burkholderiales bacterium]